MEYTSIYRSLVQRAKLETIKGLRNTGYFEKHHILPKSIGGNNEKENLVKFTAKEHFIAHLLLTRIYPKGSTERNKMIFALWRMANGKHKFKLCSRIYESLRKEFANATSKMNSKKQKGNKNSQYGKRWYTNYETGESHSFFEKPSNKWLLGRGLFNGQSSKLNKSIKGADRILYSRKIWNEFHNGKYSSIRDYCRITNKPLKFVTCMLREIPLFNKVFIPRSHNNGSKIEYVNHFEE